MGPSAGPRAFPSSPFQPNITLSQSSGQDTPHPTPFPSLLARDGKHRQMHYILLPMPLADITNQSQQSFCTESGCNLNGLCSHLLAANSSQPKLTLKVKSICICA